jgi:hypothetical protein
MSNMAYCRFQNTLLDLKDCQEALNEIDGDLTQISREEAKAAKSLIRVCIEIAQDFGDQNEQ